MISFQGYLLTKSSGLLYNQLYNYLYKKALFEYFHIDAAFCLSFAQNGAASVTIENGSYPGRELELLPPENSSFMAVDGQLQPRPFDESNMVIEEVTLGCDDIVVSGGRSCNTSAADAFAGIAPEYCVIGDNRNVGDIKNSTADAYAAAMKI